MNWDDLRIILAIGREGSLSGAARLLGLSHSTVFRQINAIERRLEVRFFNRQPSGYELTESGEAAMRVAQHMEEDVLELSRELQGRDLRLQGNIRLTAPEGVAHYLLTPYLAGFYQLHPDIYIDLIITSHTLQLNRYEADLALRVTSRPPETSVGKKICQFRMAVYASQAFLTQNQNIHMADYRYAMTSDGLNWCPANIWKSRNKPNVVFKSDNIVAVARAAVEGIGAAILPCFIGDQEPELQRVSEVFDDMQLGIWILTHEDLRQTARVRALMNYLYEQLHEQKSFIEGRTNK